MKTKLLIPFQVLLFIVSLSTTYAQFAPGGSGGGNGNQGGHGGPTGEAGGTHSTSWQLNSKGLHVNGFTNIGIGTSNPLQKLDIFGTANAFIRVTSEGGAQLNSHVSGIAFKRVLNSGLQANWDIVNQSTFRIRKEGIPVMQIDPALIQFGNINTRIALDVWGKPVLGQSNSAIGGSIILRDVENGQNQTLRMDANEINGNQGLHLNLKTNSNLSLVRGGGNVAINTTDNEAKLNINSSSNMQLKLSNTGAQGASWRIGVSNNTWLAGAGKLLFSVSPNSGDAAMTLTPSGKIGIGTTTPSKTLDVNGTISTKVLEITGGADLAEHFDISEDIELIPGSVVSIDASNAGQLQVSKSAYDKTVAGIISGAGNIQPGMLMGQVGSIAHGKHPVALTGRVYCRVDASYGAIQPGDLLTTSDTPGHAMKVSDHEKARGAIIGKAMTSLENGQGNVLVLVSLQ